MNGFWTLLGPDFAGKSTVLRRLAEEPGWKVVSYDDDRLDAAHRLIRRSRRAWVNDGFLEAGTTYSTELVLAALHPIVLFLRDEVERLTSASRDGNVIVDSYYYKLLVKCRLLGLVDESLFARWRAFPRPAGVVYLDVPPSVAWERTGNGTRLSRFEHHGESPTFADFRALQGPLRNQLLLEVATLPVVIVDGRADGETVLADVLRALRRLGSRQPMPTPAAADRAYAHG
jgi:thymidylate kinase